MERLPQGDAFEPMDYAAMLRRRWWVVALASLLGLAAAAAYTLVAPKTYTATAAVYVNGSIADASQLASGKATGAVDPDTEAQIVQSATVASQAKQRMHSPLSATALSKAVSVIVPPNSQILQISCTASRPVAAARCARAFAAAYLETRSSSTYSSIKAQLTGLQQQMGTLREKLTKLTAQMRLMSRGSRERLDANTQLSLYNAQLNSLSGHMADLVAQSVNTSAGSIVSDAMAPRSPSSPRRALALPSGLVVGLVAGLLIAYWRNRSDKRIHGAREVEALDLPVLLETARGKKAQGKKGARLGIAAPRSHLGQEFLELAYSLATTLGQGNHVLLVVGASEGHAAGVAAANIATALAATGSNVTLTCADMRSSAVPQLFGLAEGAGLAEVILDRATIADVARQPAGMPRVRIITPGLDRLAASYRLERELAERLVKTLHAVSRYVIFEAPTAAYGTDTWALAGVADAAVVVVELDRTLRDKLIECVRRLDKIGVAVLGAVALPTADKLAQPVVAGDAADAAPRRDGKVRRRAASEPVPRRDSEATGKLVYSPRRNDEPGFSAAPSATDQNPVWPVRRAEQEPVTGSQDLRSLHPLAGDAQKLADEASDPITHG
jgi:uncharacterized protein involved in exopolysaccharide biosynthesis/Mrp family chromosome partitioning ATPase